MNSITYLLENFDTKELSVLHKLLNTKENTIQQIEYQLGKILLPMSGWFLQEPLSYTKFINKIASHNNISLSSKNGTIEAEQHLYLTLFKKEFDKMSESEKEEYLKKLQVDGLDKNQIASLTAITTLGVAQASGFGVYLLASSTIGAISSAVGITLPFVLYTTMSSAISFIIGPVGFLVMGVAVYKSFKDVKNIEEIFDKLSLAYGGIKNAILGDYKTATICFNYIAAMRTVIPVKFENEINQEKNKISEYETQNENITSELSKNNQQINSSNEEITIRNNQIQKLQNEISVLKNQNYHIQSNIKKTEEDNINLRKDVDVNDNVIKNSRILMLKISSKREEFLIKTKNQE
jgi:hypothetical protein